MSRSDGRSRSLRTRPSRTVPALLAGLAMIVLGVALAWPFLMLAVTGTAPDWANRAAAWLAQRSWADPWTVTVIVVVGLVGLILMVAAVVPGRVGSYPVEPTGPSVGAGAVQATDVVISRRGMARLATAQAHRVAGVESASATVDGARVRLAVTTYVRDESAVADQVRDLVTSTLSRAGVRPLPRVSVTASRAAGYA